jgi:hypothetical protein
MRAHHIDRLFSHSLMAGWAIPFTLLLLPLFQFRVQENFWFWVAVLTVVAAIMLSRAAEVPRNYAAIEPEQVLLPAPRQCRMAVFIFSALTVLGSMLIIIDQQGALTGLDVANLQQRYVELLVASRDGERLGTGLSTVGNFLRATVYIAIVAMVALSKQSAGLRRTGFGWIALLMAIGVSEVATASRTFVVFCVAIAVTAGFVVRHSQIRRVGSLFVIGIVAVVLFSITTNQRIDATGGEADLALDFVTSLFEVELQGLGRVVADYMGFPVITGLLYLSHSLPEFSRLVADGSSQLALGQHSLYLIIAPVERLIGMEPAMPANMLAQRPGMWWGALGDLYLDFGVAFVLVYPLLMAGMIRVAQAFRGRDVFSLALRCMTAAIFFCTPYFGILNAFSFTYVLLLVLAMFNSFARNPRVESPAKSNLIPQK